MARPTWYDIAPELANYLKFYVDYKGQPRKTRVYLGTPYSSKFDATWPEIRFQLANVAAMTLIDAGFIVFSPISHSHPLALTHPVCTADHDLWLDQDESFMDWANLLVALCSPGWEDSFGLDFEINWFKKKRKPHVRVTLEQIYKIQKHLRENKL